MSLIWENERQVCGGDISGIRTGGVGRYRVWISVCQLGSAQKPQGRFADLTSEAAWVIPRLPVCAKSLA
jgi:hypothetical protein